MLNGKVFDICATHCGNCHECPLYSVCSMPSDDMQGETVAEKTEYYVAQMNEAAKAVKFEY